VYSRAFLDSYPRRKSIAERTARRRYRAIEGERRPPFSSGFQRCAETPRTSASPFPAHDGYTSYITRAVDRTRSVRSVPSCVTAIREIDRESERGGEGEKETFVQNEKDVQTDGELLVRSVLLAEHFSLVVAFLESDRNRKLDGARDSNGRKTRRSR